MALLPILHFPDPRLHTVARPITVIDDGIRQLAADMAETMYQAPGIGLAATQVDRPVRLVVIDVSEEKNALFTFINPEILWKEGETEGEEGCLSVPGVYDKVVRAERIRLQATNLNGERHELEASGLFAVCIQHEIDHLNGKVFVEYLSRLKQNRIRTKLSKQERETM